MLASGKNGFILGSDDRAVQIWIVKSGMKKYLLPCHTGRIPSIAFSPNSEILATGRNEIIILVSDKYLNLWDVKNGKKIRQSGHLCPVISVAFSLCGEFIATGRN